ncbi:hypothetical protein ABIB51_000718 [Arthrobacter sp. UYCu712]
MRTKFEAGAADGFNIMQPVFPSGLDVFVDHVIPILRERGLFLREYTGRTLREHYGLPRPANTFAPASRSSRPDNPAPQGRALLVSTPGLCAMI